MKQSFRQKLNDWIKREGQISYQDICFACNSGKFGKTYKPSNAERRLRASESPDIETIMSANGKYITAYKHKNPIQWRRMAVKDVYGNIEKYIDLPIEEERRY